MAQHSKDLFDDATMTFGEHLEVLRVHLFKALIGLVFGVIFALFFGTQIIAIIRKPIDDALEYHAQLTGEELNVEDDLETVQETDWWAYFLEQMGFRKRENNGDLSGGDSPEDADEPGTSGDPRASPELKPAVELGGAEIEIAVRTADLLEALHNADPENFPAPADDLPARRIRLVVAAPEFAEFKSVAERSRQAVTLNVQEAFMTYLKVSLIAGLVLTSPWVFFQIWQFVAAGLYKNERKFVYIYGTLSLFLFVLGVVFCFFLVFPFVLDFLLGFNRMMKIVPQIRLSEWISFAIILPLMFGLSFQLPLVMKFLQAISIFEVSDYRSKRRLAVLVIATLSMFLTPADPMSMLLMMCPLVVLYELGIVLCRMSGGGNPFGSEPA
ncbi:MAG: twin-arginine translocase subunit TatC [Maioricimonas sp. JB049]